MTDAWLRNPQSLFDILASVIEDATVYDCFAGTGSMGLECLSRGAKFATFFEADRSALKRLEKNIAAIGAGERSRVMPGDLFRWFEAQGDALTNTGADLIFLDPPYRFLRERQADLQRLATRFAEGHLKPGGTVIFRHDAHDELALPGLTPTDVRTYGAMTLEFLLAD